MFIETERTPNPATLKFLPGGTVMAEGTADFAAPEAAQEEYGVVLVDRPVEGAYDGVVLAVAHREFAELGPERIRALGGPDAVLFDVKAMLPKDAADLRL